MSEEESTIERFTKRVRHIMWLLIGLFVFVVAGAVAVARFVDPLAAVAFVVVVSALVGMLFPRLT